MNRRLLLTLAGLGTSAVAVFLMSGTAHALALAPAPAAPRPALPVGLVVPTPVTPTAPHHGSVETVTTKVVETVTHVPPVTKVVESVPVVVQRVPTIVVSSLPALPVAAHRSLAVAPKRLHAARSSRASMVHTSKFAAAPSRASSALRSTRTRRSSHRSPFALLLPGLSDNALTPARSSAGSPFAALATRMAHVGTVTHWLAFPTADRTRPGFLVGSARPG
jgi:hypothetical protein